jgi:hypothetical protein
VGERTRPDQEIFFDVEDYQADFYDDCGVYFLTRRTQHIVLSCLRYAEYFGTRWRRGGVLIGSDDSSDIRGWIDAAFSEVIMSCDFEVFERIAAALESLDEKTSSRITYDEFINDLEDAFGVTSFIVTVTKGFFGLLPSIILKMDFTRLVMAVWELYTWKAPVLALLGQITAAQWVQAITGTTSAVLAKARQFASFFIGPNLADLIFGEIDPYTWLSNNLIALGIKEEDGGIGGENPDADPNIHLDVNLFSDLEVHVTSDCCDLAQGSGMGNYAGTQTITPGAGGPGGGPIIDAEPSTAIPVDQDKCNYSAYIVEKYLEYLAQSANTFTDIGSSARVFAVWINSIPLIFSSLAVASSVMVLFGYCIGLVIAGIPLTIALTSLKANLEETKNQLICDLHDLAATPAQARSLIEAWITAGLPVSLPASWVTYHAEHLFTNTVLNQIFDNTWNIGEFTHDCTCGEGCADVVMFADGYNSFVAGGGDGVGVIPSWPYNQFFAREAPRYMAEDNVTFNGSSVLIWVSGHPDGDDRSRCSLSILVDDVEMGTSEIFNPKSAGGHFVPFTGGYDEFVGVTVKIRCQWSEFYIPNSDSCYIHSVIASCTV